mmetsp:Transcript_17053/g.33300  ORF Transcript_17053/g.33300 Transcript_17053/m.33300 type:complete len:532 (+) Transcript_17053:86-1681(+)
MAPPKRLLFFSWPGGRSHGSIAVALANELHHRGYDITIICWDPDCPVLHKELHVPAQLVGHAVQGTDAMARLTGEVKPPRDLGWDDFLWLAQKLAALNDPLMSIDVAVTFSCEACVSALQSPAVQTAIRSADFVVADVANVCSTFSAAYFDLPLMWYTPVGLVPPILPDVGPAPAAYVPTVGSLGTHRMSIWKASFNWINGMLVRHVALPRMTEVQCAYLLRPFNFSMGFDLGSSSGCADAYRRTTSRTGVKLVLSDTALEFPRDVASNVQFVGHPLSRPAAPIGDENVREFADGATNGLVLISLGNHGAWFNPSRTLHLAEALRDALAGVHVVWKVSKADARDLANFTPSSTMMLISWMDQQDILGHPNCRVFVTHGGHNSVQEAAFHGVPVVGTPLLVDQFDNLVRPLERGFGQTLDHKTFTVDDLIRAIKAALHEPKYRHNAQQIKQRLRAHTRLPVQRAADWIEYAVRTDGAPFLTPIAYTETDLVWQCAPALVVTGAIALVMGVICATTRRLCRLCRMSKPRAKRE